MAEEITKQIFNAKAEILANDIEDNDIGIMTHKPDALDGGDRKWKFITLYNWIKTKLLAVFVTPTQLNTKLEDYPTNDSLADSLEKLDGIEENAQKNVQSDWNETDEDSDAFILNKPSITVVDAVESGNQNAVSSNAVSGALSDFSFDHLSRIEWNNGYLTSETTADSTPKGAQDSTKLEISSKKLSVPVGKYRVTIRASLKNNYEMWAAVGLYNAEGKTIDRLVAYETCRCLCLDFTVTDDIKSIRVSYRSYNNIVCELHKISS